MGFNELLQRATKAKASDIFIISGEPLSYKKGTSIIAIDTEIVMPESSRALVAEAYAAADRDMKILLETGDDDFAVSIKNLARFRVSSYKQRSSLAAVIRIIPFGIPDYKKFNIPETVMEVAEHTKGLVLVTGPAGSGKSTTQACIIDRINKTREGHIITLEEPIEYLYKNDKSIISQREISLDTVDYITALRACLRQSPDVILLGEMRDFETIKTAMTAAETGHLVISTLHTIGSVNTIDRIIDIFPPNQQQQIRVQLAMLLRSVVSQQLIRTIDGDLIPVFEVMHANSAIRNMIRESKIHQIESIIGVSSGEGMASMDVSLLELYRAGRITAETAMRYALGNEMMAKRISAFKG
ncbi:MAG: PilT/PilU family type 4a pilus ATPase [Lachnospiraceae bacterium]|nr:PilT/PilU family type 4a pilus ATPase [Lachnospiraceae bacterium]